MRILTRKRDGLSSNESSSAAPPLVFVSPSEMADYRRAFAGGATRADAEGRLWVRTIPTKPLAGGAEYDVIDAQGKMVR